MNTSVLFIGANNITKQLERKKLEQVLDIFAEGYTITESMGAWQGLKEPSVIVYISGLSSRKLQSLIRDLKRELGQDAIGLIQLPEMFFI